jgi:formylglycine-generating enzyme required for sulfatase activity
MRLLPLPISFILLQACDGKAVVDIENQPPSAPTVSIGPNDPRTTDDLVAVIDAEARDADGDAVTYSYSWKQDGLPREDLGANTVPNSETTKGEVWEVTVTPNDGALDGATASATTTIANALPTATLAFNPAAPVNGDDVQAVATALDDDGDAVTFTYAWTLDGAAQTDTGDTIPADRTEHGQRWAVTVTPVDIEGTGLPVTAEVQIANSAPEVLGVTLVPDAPYVTDDVVAVVEGYDADADAITYTYTFFVDGTEAQSGDSDTLVAGSFAKHQRVSVEVVPNDGFDDGEAFVSADAEVANSLPRAIRATIDPSTAYEISTLTCLPAGFSDADGDVESWTYAWSVNGTEVGTTATLDGASFNKGDAITCAATPFDGEASGTAVTSSVTIANTAPVLASVTLSTVAPTENDTITVSLGAASDDDGDSITYSYDWYVNGSMVSTSSSLLPNRFKKADSIYVVVTPWDGADLGTPISSSTATGANTAPSVTTVTLTPTTVYTNDTLTAAVSATDLDGDTLSYTYDWYVDGVPRGSASSATLSGTTYFDKGQDVYVVVTPSDGSVDGTTGTSSTVTVSNTAPTAPVVEVTPADAVEGDDLTCTVTTASTDADGDSMTYAFAWDVDGVDYASAADSAYSSVVDGADVGDGEEWTCEVTASDGTGTGSAGSDSVTANGGFTDYTTTYGSTMVAITAGSFSMGSTTGDADEAPVHTVTLTHDFWIGQTEVTQAEYRAGMGTSPSYFSSCGTTCPVEQVSWTMAAVYANALSTAEGLSLCYTATGSGLATALGGDPYACEGYRLPTEAEWEYAAKAGGSYTYSGSNTVGDVAWYSTNSSSKTHAVAGKSANTFGLYDMSGNVWEWTNDWYGAYSSGSAIDPVGASSGSIRVLRGGSWYVVASAVGVAERSGSTSAVYDFGFRLVRSVP